MPLAREIVITGLGVVSPIGVGWQGYWAALLAGRSGVGPITQFDPRGVPVPFGGEVRQFDAKEFVKPRKSLKVMAREIQFGVACAAMAYEDAGLTPQSVDPERMGVVLGTDLIQGQAEDVAEAFRRAIVDGRFDFSLWGEAAMREIYPLWMLKYLPNMPACHIAIALDARGPNNTHALGEVSSLLAMSEAVRVLERGMADVMLCGGTGSRLNPVVVIRSCLTEVSHRADEPERACRPFDADRDGQVNGEGAAVFVMETRQHALARGARIRARVLGYGCACVGDRDRRDPAAAVEASIRQALGMAGCSPRDVGHVNAHGISTREGDRMEARAIRAALGDVPVTALKSYFGNLGSGTGAVEALGSVLALEHGIVPHTLNYDRADPACPVNVVRGQPLRAPHRVALLLNQAPTGQAAALVLACEE
jgi:3-oxoacyl-[acyl-carrier-protein] synthase II